MSQFRRTPDGLIDYDSYRKDANRLRREARNRFVSRAASAICFPFWQMARFMRRWQATWPAPAKRQTVTPLDRYSVSLFAGLAKARALFW